MGSKDMASFCSTIFHPFGERFNLSNPAWYVDELTIVERWIQAFTVRHFFVVVAGIQAVIQQMFHVVPGLQSLSMVLYVVSVSSRPV